MIRRLVKSPFTASGRGPREGIGHQHLQRLGSASPASESRVRIGAEGPQVGDGVRLRRPDHPGPDPAEVGERGQHPGELRALVGQHLQAGAEVLDRGPMSSFCAASRALSRSRPSSARTISLLCSSRPPMKVSSWRIAPWMSDSWPSHRLGQLDVDRLELRDTATVEQQGQRREDLLDLRVPAGTVQRDGVAVSQPAGASPRRSLERHELLAEQAGLAQLGDRVVRQLDRVQQPQARPGRASRRVPRPRRRRRSRR